MAVMWRVYIDYTSNSTCIHATCIREYQCQLWKDILRLRVLQWSLIQAATVCKHLTLTISRPYICNSTRRDQIKNQRTAQFPESSNQTAANQKKVRCSPTAFERRIYVLTVTLRKTSFPTRGTSHVLRVFRFLWARGSSRTYPFCRHHPSAFYPSPESMGLHLIA